MNYYYAKIQNARSFGILGIPSRISNPYFFQSKGRHFITRKYGNCIFDIIFKNEGLQHPLQILFFSLHSSCLRFSAYIILLFAAVENIYCKSRWQYEWEAGANRLYKKII